MNVFKLVFDDVNNNMIISIMINSLFISNSNSNVEILDNSVKSFSNINK